MKIDAIIQSTNYSDMLALTLPLNKKHFDHIVVYTRRGDEETKAVCAREGVECVETDLFNKGGSKFNRGAVYNEAFRAKVFKPGLSTLDLGFWCILDSDIVLHDTFRADLETCQLDKELFYGARRYNVETYEQWLAVKANPDTLNHLVLFRGYGYGYLQIFHPLSTTFVQAWRMTQGNPYLEWEDGSTADWVFRNLWGDHQWEPPTQPPDHALYHNVPEPCDPPNGDLRKLPFNVIHLGITGVGATGRGTPLWNVQSV